MGGRRGWAGILEAPHYRLAGMEVKKNDISGDRDLTDGNCCVCMFG